MTADTRTVLVTGCSSGIGRATARRLRDGGFRVLATARRAEDIDELSGEGFEALEADYAEPSSLHELVETVARRTGGRLFALVNNGAYAQAGALEDVSRDLLRQQFEVNVFGWHDLARRCIPLMRAQGGGRIVQVSSLLGLVAMKWRGAYVASKYAVEGLSDTMRLELKGSGVEVVLIEPGPIRTRIVERSIERFRRTIDADASAHASEYRTRLADLARDRDAPWSKEPDAVARVVLRALESPRPRARYYVTAPTYVLAALRRILPVRVMDHILDKASDA